MRVFRTQAPLAQLDRVFGYEPKGRGFESLTACQKKHLLLQVLFCYPGENFSEEKFPPGPLSKDLKQGSGLLLTQSFTLR